MNVNDPGRVLILGAGPTGLGAAYRLQELGMTDFQLLEQGPGPGGLAASHVDSQGFTWDLGGHVQFSHYAYYDSVLELALKEWLWHERESWVWLKERFIPYPFQNNIHRLDAQDRERVLDGLRHAARSRVSGVPPAHFGEWLERNFGRALCDLFMSPYNTKVWGCPPSAMGVGWMGERVAVPDLERIERNIREQRDDVSWGPNNRFRFPLRGGTGAIWKGVVGLIGPEHLSAGCHVVRLELDARVAVLEDGRRLGYDTLISTLPIDVLSRICEPLPPEVRRAGSQMRYSSVHVLGVGLRHGKPESLTNKCWMYFPEEHSPYYRVTVFSNYSPHLVPEGDGYWSLMAEVCESADRPLPARGLMEWTVDAMRRDALISPGAEVVSRWHMRLEHGYPTPFTGRDEVLAQIHPALEARRVYSRGRFGGWKYEAGNQDHSFMQGVELADRLMLGKPEVTYPDPNRANSGIFLAKG
ncbi:protoporphyrinogen/coproporphyrinogen oxidase [Stigmatella hybrida]|uniref:protoporphyrinogen/coproporphyrinogen oxidase n=1 Tax=Stigmatella hybrida TaxID=394097 RepID=UPI001CDB3EE8|nr:FAD-dependent oxidoreductase [Stigmatella hybrida]